jgi:ABC-2 type transport system permease protein
MSAVSIPWVFLGGVLQVFYYERALGTLSVLLGAHGRRAPIYFSRAAVHWANAVLALAASLLFSWAFLGLDLSRLDPLTLAGAFLLITASSAAFALCLGNVAIAFQEWNSIVILSNGIFIALTGAVIPRDSLPGVLYAVGEVLPLSHGLVAFRAAFAGATLPAVAGDLLGELVVALAYAVAGFFVFRLLEDQARRRGNSDAIE